MAICAVARDVRCCHGRAHGLDRKVPHAGGALLAFSMLAGTIAGCVYRQPSIGFLAGLGAGLLLLALVWLIDRR